MSKVGTNNRSRPRSQQSKQTNKPPARRTAPTGYPENTPAGEWPAACFRNETKFGTLSAKLMPLVGKPVWTPRGPGMLLQVMNVARVVLDCAPEDRTVDFRLDEIAPLKV